MRHAVGRGGRSTMEDEARRRRRTSRRDGWLVVLLGNPTTPGDSSVDGAPTASLGDHVTVPRPRRLYREVEERWGHAPSEVLLRALLLTACSTVVGVVVGVAALTSLATGNSASGGAVVGLVLACLALGLALLYLGWGAVVDRWGRRRPER